MKYNIKQMSHLSYYGRSLLIAIVLNMIILVGEYKGTRIGLNFVIGCCLLMIIGGITLNMLVELKKEHMYWKRQNQYQISGHFLAMIVVWAIAIRFVFILEPPIAVVWGGLLLTIMTRMISITGRMEDISEQDIDSLTLVIAFSCVILVALYIVQVRHPRVAESYKTTQDSTFIQKEKGLFSDGYDMYDTSGSKKKSFIWEHLDHYDREIFAKYILKNMNHDLKVDLTMYDDKTNTYKIMYGDATVQNFKFSDLKLDDEVKYNILRNILISKTISEKENKEKERANKEELRIKREKLENHS